MPVALEMFRSVIPKLSSLVADGPVALRVLRGFNLFSINFDLHFRDEAVLAALEELGLARSDFEEALVDVQEVLSALAQEIPLNRSSEEKGSEDDDTTKAKFEITREHFDIDALKQRTWIKANSKNDLLMESGWDVSLKLLDETEHPPEGKPVAEGLLALKGSRFSSPFALFNDDAKELTMTVDRQDIKAIRETLRRLDEALSDAEQGGMGHG